MQLSISPSTKLLYVPNFYHLFSTAYIDDAIGIWRCNPDPIIDLANWTKFQEAMNSYGILTWDPFTQETQVNFMDVTISYDPSTIALVTTTVYVRRKRASIYIYHPGHAMPLVLFMVQFSEPFFDTRKSALVLKTFIC